MLDELKAELMELAQKLERQNKILTMLKSLKNEESSLADTECQLRRMLDRENSDVERLERTTATAIFYSVLGKKEEQLEKEQREAYAAKLKYDAAVRQLDDCRERIQLLEYELQELSDCEHRYRQVFEEIQELLRHDPRYAQSLCDLERQLGEISAQLREVQEAICAGEACMNQIYGVENSLESAEGWGTWDIFGGGLISDLAKHSRLDEAQCGAEQLQTLLSRFRTELADVKISAQMERVNVDGFLRFADYFFDGFVADWCVLSHIHDSQESVAQVKCQVSDALSRLEALTAVYEKERVRLEGQISALVYRA